MALVIKTKKYNNYKKIKNGTSMNAHQWPRWGQSYRSLIMGHGEGELRTTRCWWFHCRRCLQRQQRRSIRGGLSQRRQWRINWRWRLSLWRSFAMALLLGREGSKDGGWVKAWRWQQRNRRWGDWIHGGPSCDGLTLRWRWPSHWRLWCNWS